MNEPSEVALQAALRAVIAGLTREGMGGLATLDMELRLMLRRTPAGSSEADLLLVAQAALAEARATRH